MTTQNDRWEQRLYDYVNNSVNPPSNLMTYITQREPLPFNTSQRNAVRELANPVLHVPQRTGSNQDSPRVTNIPLEQFNLFTDLGDDFDTSRKVVASALIIGPPGTGKTHVICAGSILRVFSPPNLVRSNPIRLYIATFSNAGSYRVFEKFHEIASLANEPRYLERIKLVQSMEAQRSYSFELLRRRLNLNPGDFIISNRMSGSSYHPTQWNEFLREILIFIGTTDSLGILTTDRNSTANTHGVIYDEASQLTVPQFFQIIPRNAVRSVCVVGDDAQLPPVTTLAPLGVSALTYLHGMNTYQNIPIPETRRFILQEQYRMHPAIAQLTERLLSNIRTVIPSGPTTSEDYTLPVNNYDLSNLQGTFAQSTLDILDDILNPLHTLVIIDTSNIPEAIDRSIGRSRLNLIEGQIAVGIYNAIRYAYDTSNNEDFNDEDIILTAPYRQQVNFFVRNNVRTGTVHQFQGQEAEVVIYSLTFARPGAKSEFFSQLELMYVGLSRAKRKLIILGNRNAIDYPDLAIQHVRNVIFNFRYISGGQGYPPYVINPVCRREINQQFLTDIINNLI